MSSQPAPRLVELVRPFIKELESGSVLIDITHVKDHSLLRIALDAFNKEAEADIEHNEFSGRLEKTRAYLNHVFMETIWASNTPSYREITTDGILLSNGTFIKGFPSYAAESTIV